MTNADLEKRVLELEQLNVMLFKQLEVVTQYCVDLDQRLLMGLGPNKCRREYVAAISVHEGQRRPTKPAVGEHPRFMQGYEPPISPAEVQWCDSGHRLLPPVGSEEYRIMLQRQNG